MIQKEEFINLISKHQEWDKKIDEVGKVFGCVPTEMSWIDYSNTLFEYLIGISFNDNGQDTIYWWLYEKLPGNNQMWDANGNEIPTETIEDLWNIVKDNRIQ